MLKKTAFTDLLFIIISGALYGVAFAVFLQPSQISPGGITGLAAIINYFLPVNITGLIVLLLNIPLYLVGLVNFGKEFLLKSFLSTLSMSVFIDIFTKILPRYNGDRMLSALFSGVLVGVSLAIILLRGFTTGGVDIAVKLVLLKKPFVSFGRLILLFDGIIVLLASFVYKNIETALYSFVMLFASSKIIDNLLYGADKGKLMLVITEKVNTLKPKIMQVSGRGATVFNVEGGYTGKNKQMLMCVLRFHELAKVRNIIKQVDCNAFVIITEVGEILGLGFKTI